MHIMFIRKWNNAFHAVCSVFQDKRVSIVYWLVLWAKIQETPFKSPLGHETSQGNLGPGTLSQPELPRRVVVSMGEVKKSYAHTFCLPITQT